MNIKRAASRPLIGKTRGTRLDSTRLCWCVRIFVAAIVSKPQSDSRLFVNLTGLDWTRLDSVGVYAPVLGKKSVPLLVHSEFRGLAASYVKAISKFLRLYFSPLLR